VTLGLALVASLASPACTADLGSPVDWEDVVETEDGVLLWARARGAEAGLPLLLVLHGGPGYAMQGLLHQRLPELESSFVVVEYDQRGAGLSYDPGIDPATMTLATFVSDAESVLSAVEGALGRPPAPVVVMGHSMGTMIGLDLVAADPPRFAAYVGVGQVVQVVENEQASWDFAHASAEAAALLEATTELDCVGRPLDDFSYPGSSDPSCDPELDGFEVTSRWVGWFGGAYWGEQGTDWLDEEILMLEAYQGSEDAWIDGSEFSAFLFDDPAVLSWDARVDHASPDVPVRLLTGRHDYDTPAPLVEAYAEGLDDPDALRWFEDSAHFPFLEEPDAFLEAMLEVADDLASQ
jgi:pimeloyl-ACP methyl ester carboxylesterase